MSDNVSLEALLNDDMSESDGVNRNLRVTNARIVVEGYRVVYRESGTTAYFCFENKDGEWYIQKEVIAGAITTATYAKGTSDVATAWTGRAGQSYALFSVTFG